MKNAGLGYLFTGIFALGGLVAGLFFFSELYSRYKITKNGIETIGTVVEVKYKTEKNTRMAAPVIEYKTATGATEVYDSDLYWNTGIEANTIPPGTLIPVLVDIDHPQRRYRVDVSQWSPSHAAHA